MRSALFLEVSLTTTAFHPGDFESTREEPAWNGVSVLENREGLNFCGEFWFVYIFASAEPPPTTKAVHFRQLGMAVAIPSIQLLRGGRGEAGSG